MASTSWLRFWQSKYTSRVQVGRDRQRAKKRAAVCPRLEALEDRLVFATRTWINQASHCLPPGVPDPCTYPYWSNDRRWEGRVTPRSGDDLVFPPGAGSYNNLYDGFLVNSISLSGASLSGNNLGLRSITQLLPGTSTISLSIGILDRLDVTVAAGATLTIAGTISGPSGSTLFKHGPGTLVLTGNNTYQGTTVVNAGTLSAQHANALGATAAGTTVNAGAALELTGGRTFAPEPLTLNGGQLRSGPGANTWTGPINLVSSSTLTAPTGVLVVDGVVSGPAAAGLTVAGPSIVLLMRANTYAGPTVVNGGLLAIRDAASLGATSAGTTVNAGAALEVGGFGLRTAPEPLTLNGGHLRSEFGANAWTGPVSLAASSTLGAAAGISLQVEGVISGPAAATLTKLNSGSVTLGGANTYAGPTVVNDGTLALSNGTALGATSAGTTVNAGATLEVTGGRTFTPEPLTLDGGQLRSGPGTNTWTGPISLVNRLYGSDTLAAPTGVLVVDGVISGPPAATLTIAGASIVLLMRANTYAGPTVVNSGTLAIRNASSLGATSAGTTVNAGAALEVGGYGLRTASEPLTLAGGQLRSEFGANTWAGPLSLAGSSTLAAAAGISLLVTEPVTGPDVNNLTKAGDGTVTLASPFNTGRRVVVQAGVLAFTGGGTSTGNFTTNTAAILEFGGAAYTLSEGSRVSGEGTTRFSGGIKNVAGAYEVGATSVTAGEVNFRADATTGVLNNAGTVSIGPTSFTVNNGFYTQTAGRTILGGGVLVAAVDVQAGSLEGTGYIFGEVSNAGRMIVGGAGAAGGLYIFGNYMQTATGTLDIELGGRTPEAEHDYLYIDGTATLDGVLNITLLGEYWPNVDDLFSFLATGGGITGDFTDFTGLDLGAGLALLPINDGFGYHLSAYAT